MAVHNNEKLNDIIDKCGSRYSATVFVATEAKNLCNKYNDVLSHSEAIAWILSGKEPYTVKNYEKIVEEREKRPLNYARTRLLDITDIEVREAVEYSISRSIRSGHLIYSYKNVFDRYRCSRVRILTRMIWDEMKHLGFKH